MNGRCEGVRMFRRVRESSEWRERGERRRGRHPIETPRVIFEGVRRELAQSFPADSVVLDTHHPESRRIPSVPSCFADEGAHHGSGDLRQRRFLEPF